MQLLHKTNHNFYEMGWIEAIIECPTHLYPPRRPAPSARISSSSGVAPPVIKERMSVRAF